MSYNNLLDLEAYEAYIKLRSNISDLIKQDIPRIEKYLLANQITRASRSATANIAEGHGRYHLKENIQYCRMARGSLYELMDHLSVALDEKYIKKDQLKKIHQ